METIRPETLKVATDEKTGLTTKADLIEELQLKKDMLKSKQARLNGGVCPIMRRELLPILKELKDLDIYIEIKEIERDYFAPVTVEWEYQRNYRWLEINKLKIQEMIDDLKAKKESVLKQAETIHQEIKELEARVKILTEKISEMPDEPTNEEIKITPVL